MALTPEETGVLETTLDEGETVEIAPSKTWRIDFDKGTIGGFIDGDDAKHQFVYKALVTERNKYPIYTDAYGNELFDLIGEDMSNAFLSIEVPRMCKEAVVYDERIESANVSFTRDRSTNTLYVTVDVTLYNGETITIEGVEIDGL